ncbi:MAG: hypothetical protein IKG36_02425, partial [Mycoplasmataceae bacterium]|nr:hypothetical protein [Mycoplasmataceae bacterium]
MKQKDQTFLTSFKKYFKFDTFDAIFKKEIIGGLSTFLAMAYILAVNPSITLVARLKQLGTSTVAENNNQNVTNIDLISKINSILNSNSQASSELSIWSNIV